MSELDGKQVKRPVEWPQGLFRYSLMMETLRSLTSTAVEELAVAKKNRPQIVSGDPCRTSEL